MKIAVHIGFHKTATTFFQEYIFKKNNKINYLGKDWKGKNIKIFYDLFNLKYSSLKKKYNKINFLYLNKKKINLFSEERLSSIFYYKEKNIEIINKKLNYLFLNYKNVKIVFFIRNQADLILSRYSENSKIFTKFSKKINKFEDLIKLLDKKSQKSNQILDNFKYYNFYRLLNKKFPKKDIKIIIYEDFKQNNYSTIKELYKFFGIKSDIKLNLNKINNLNTINQSFKINGRWEDKVYSFLLEKILERILPNFIYNKIYKLVKTLKVYFQPNKICISETTKTKIKKYFNKDNKKLLKIIPSNKLKIFKKNYL